MDVNTILKLVDAGFTGNEIREMTKEISVDDSAAVGEPLKESESSEPSVLSAPSAAASEQAEASQDNAGIDALKQIVSDLTAQLSDLRKAVQKNNIINSEQPPQKPVETAADILAAIINPHINKE